MGTELVIKILNTWDVVEKGSQLYIKPPSDNIAHPTELITFAVFNVDEVFHARSLPLYILTARGRENFSANVLLIHFIEF